MSAQSRTPEQELEDIRTETSGQLWIGVPPDTKNSFIQLQLSLKDKYRKIDFIRLIKENAKSRDWGQRLLRALDRIYQCGVDMLKPKEERPPTWRMFEYEDPKYTTDIRTLKITGATWENDLPPLVLNEGTTRRFLLLDQRVLGTKEILYQIGFTRERQQSFFHYKRKPDTGNDIVEVSAELYLAKSELECYLRGEHSREDEFSVLVGQEFRPGACCKTIPDLTPRLPHDCIHMPFHENQEILQDPMRSDDKTTEMLPETETRCQHCQFINLPDAELCISCAEPLMCEMNSPAVLKRETLQPTTQEMQTEKTCQFCTYINPPEVTVCVMCSKTLTDGAEPEDKEFNMQGACGGYIPAEVETYAEFQNGYEDHEENYNVRQCAACTYLNPVTTNICEMCYTSLIGNVNDAEQKIAGDMKDPNSNTNTEGAVGTKGEAGSYNLTSSKKSSGQDSRKVSKGSITLLHGASGSFLKEKTRCPRCESKCQPNLGPFEDRICKSCGYKFCDACSRPFLKNCKWNRHCPKGPHCHHPRDCVFYLRKFRIKSLKKLLSTQDLEYAEMEDWVKMEAKRRKCSAKVIANENNRESKWLCQPYMEYIISIINRHNVDPAVIMNPQQLTAVIRREHSIEISGTKGRALLEFVQKNCPLR